MVRNELRRALEFDGTQLRQLGEWLIEVGSDADVMEPPKLDSPPVNDGADDHSDEPFCDNAALSILASKEYHDRRLRKENFPGTVFGEPAWDILLDLFANGLQGKFVSITSACIAADVPATTGLRWVSILEKEGLVRKTPDANDRRRSWVGLTQLGFEKMAAHFKLVVQRRRI